MKSESPHETEEARARTAASKPRQLPGGNRPSSVSAGSVPNVRAVAPADELVAAQRLGVAPAAQHQREQVALRLHVERLELGEPLEVLGGGVLVARRGG